MAARSLCWGTWRSASSHHSDSCLSPPPALGTLRGPQKVTFHQKSENVNQEHSCFSLWDTCDGRKADQLVCWVLSRPLPLQDKKLIFFKPVFHYQCLHTHKNNLFTKTHTNKLFWMFENESTHKKHEQQKFLLLYPSWKGAWVWTTEETSEQIQSAKGHVNSVWRGCWEWLKRHTRSPASRSRCNALSLQWSMSPQRASLWIVQPDVETFTNQHTGYPSCELLSQNTLHWSMKNNLSLLAPHKTSVLLSLSHITAVAVDHPYFWQFLQNYT